MGMDFSLSSQKKNDKNLSFQALSSILGVTLLFSSSPVVKIYEKKNEIIKKKQEDGVCEKKKTLSASYLILETVLNS